MNVKPNDQYIRYRSCACVSLPAVSQSVSFQGATDAKNLQVFHHHIYEFKKGLRNLVLTTENADKQESIERRLIKENIAYVIHHLSEHKINIYFGQQSCIDIIKTFDERLNEISPEQDFILGIMLGYDRLKQCDRYLKIKSNLKQGKLIG